MMADTKPFNEEKLDANNKPELLAYMQGMGLHGHDLSKTKKQLIELIKQRRLVLNDLQGNEFLPASAQKSSSTPEGETKQVEEIMDLISYQVRYVGKHHQIIQNPASTKTGTEYIFPRGTWITVFKEDWEKYHMKAEGAVKRSIVPQWEVRQQNNVTKAIKDFFKGAVEKILGSREATELTDILNIHEGHYYKLKENGILNIRMLAQLTPENLSNMIGLDLPTAIDALKDAKEVLNKNE